jgi:hypothetical protein
MRHKMELWRKWSLFPEEIESIMYMYVYIYAPYYIALNLWILIPDLDSNNCSYLRHISKGHFKIKGSV